MQSKKNRAINQKLYLVDVENNNKKFVIMGTTGNIYSVFIKPKSECSCPDFTMYKNKCKHIYFVLIKILNIHNIFNFGKEDEILNDYEISKLLNEFSLYKNLFIDTNLKSKYNNLLNGVPIKIDDVCPICLDDVNDDSDLDYCKYSCGKAIHKKCLSLYSSYNKSIKCPFCSANFNLPISSNYINIK